jgi:mRNA interferase MazF
MSMKNFSANEIVLVRFPFSDLSASKIRPAVIISSPHLSQDVFIVPLTSRTAKLQEGEFLLDQWKSAGLNVPSAVKRGIFTIAKNIILKSIGKLHDHDAQHLEKAVKSWLCWK